MKVVAIIPAAGLGTRMASAPESKGKKPVASKQFTDLRGTPILIHTLQKFAASPEVSEIYVALRKNEISGIQNRLEQDESNIMPTKPQPTGSSEPIKLRWLSVPDTTWQS